MTQMISKLDLTIKATAAVTGERFVTAAGAPAAAAGNALGVARSDAQIGGVFPVTYLGTAIVSAGGAVAVGAGVEADATGRAVTLAAGKKLGTALQAAAAAGDRIEVALIPN